MSHGNYKHCTRCGRDHALQSWLGLARLGYQSKGLDTAGELLEIRRCTCGTVLAIDMGELPDAIWLAEPSRPSVAPPPAMHAH